MAELSLSGKGEAQSKSAAAQAPGGVDGPAFNTKALLGKALGLTALALAAAKFFPRQPAVIAAVTGIIASRRKRGVGHVFWRVGNGQDEPLEARPIPGAPVGC